MIKTEEPGKEASRKCTAATVEGDSSQILLTPALKSSFLSLVLLHCGTNLRIQYVTYCKRYANI